MGHIPFGVKPNETVLEALDAQRIVYFMPDGDKMIIGESCDGYFTRVLTKDQFGLLIAELQKLYDAMPML